jgi:hypothetical protein
MTTTNFRSAALSVIALSAGLAATSASAQDRYAAPIDSGAVYLQPGDADPVAGFVPPNVRGHFTCTFNEVHSRLERKSCSGTHYRD